MSGQNIVKYIFIVVILNLCWNFSDSRRIKRIVGGTPVMCGEQPRVVSLRNSSSNQHLCGATIINPDFAITAAHCVSGDADQYILQLNNICVEKNSTYPEAKVEKIYTHELYNKHSRAHDIAILQIRLALDDVTWLNDSVLPTSSFGLSGECTVYGNGYTDPDIQEISKTLQAAVVRIVSLDKCIELLGPYVAPENDYGMLCALGLASDACQGDSGGPLFCKNSLLEGISSYGMGCGVDNLPGVYTSIGPHISWIGDVMQTYNQSRIKK